MNRNWMIVGLFCIALTARAGAADWPLSGRVVERSVVAAEVPPRLRAQTQVQAAEAFENEFRIQNSRGESVPYVLRERKVPRVTHENRWQRLQIVSVAETNGQLTVQTTCPLTAGSFTQIRISTPLTDFEQTVSVLADGREIGRGRLCDYSRFAQFRQTEFACSHPFTSRLTLVFSKPTSEQESATFEKMITMRGDGKVDAQSIRRQVTERTFRVTEIALAYEASATHWERALSRSVPVPCIRTEDARGQRSIFTFNARFLPVERIDLAFDRGTYEREVHLETWTGERWRNMRTGRIRALDLPDAQTRQLSIGWGTPERLGICRLVVMNGDSPVLTCDPAKLLNLACPSEEVVFIAEPNESYVGMFVKGGMRPNYDPAVSSYIAGKQVPCTFAFEQQLPELPLDQTLVDESQTEPSWLMRHGIKLATTVVFVILLGVCFALFRGNGRSAKKAPIRQARCC